MASDNLERNLRDGIEAARRGDKLTARRLLQSVLQQDRANETALMWMASVVDTAPEKRAYLEQVLRVNPKNDRARQALERLGGTAPAAPKPAAGAGTAPPPRPMPAPKPAPRRGQNPYFLAAIGVAVVMGAILLVFLATQPGGPLAEAPTPTPVVIAAFAETPAGEATEQADQGVVLPTDTPRPTATTPGVIVTLDPNQVVLPPTFTPPPTSEPTVTLTPSPTPLPLSTYPILFAAIPTGGSIPALFRGLADGTQIENVGDDRGYYDLALSPDGEQIAFIRSVTSPEGGDANLQLFTAPVDDPTRVRQLTGTLNAGMEHPVWARDGQSIVVAANLDGDLDLFRVAADPDGEAALQALTVNTAFDSYPAYSPDGARLVYVSDVNTPGFPRLFTFDAAGTPQPFSNVSGSLSDPAFSPDGSQIAYVNRQTGDPDIWVINADGQRPFQLTVNDSATDRAIAWSDDGAWLAFASDRINSRFLWFFLNPDSGQIVPLSDLSEAQSLAFLPR